MSGCRRSNSGKTLLYCLAGAIWIVVCVCFPQWTPRCLLRLVSGFDCPACGLQRAVGCLAAGEFRAAFWCNPYLALVSPYLLLVVAAEAGGTKTANLRERITGRRIVIAAAVVMVGWWILRNTPLWHGLLAVYAPPGI